MIMIKVERIPTQVQAEKPTIPQGYEILGETLPLSMLPTIAWSITQVYDQRYGRYEVLIHSCGEVVAFLSTVTELDALCAMIEWCVDLLSYWPMTDPEMIEQWRSIWWMVQTFMSQQNIRQTQD